MASDFQHLIRRADLKEGPVDLVLQATDAQCRSLAARFDLVALKRFIAHLRVEEDGEDIVVSGDIDADVVQSCVATLADVPSHVTDNFTVRYIPVAETESGEDEVLIDVESAEDVEPLKGDVIDVAETAAHSLSLALDPYPHAEGVARVTEVRAEPRSDADDDIESNPFAVLKKLHEKG